ncbi:hypothetical protein AYR62_02090 [Secundilactobacillus paracollinoides]|uniref:Uncharacterized protein n=1 Tax=Secundilactobacillus paracollinoides TaxID=240427 RepID=A0A1B2IUT1_9LACO|nr:hypothetical protein [Secundilactobacillus paracollinoides]ANZ60033.1 hypothetical protein AYR61_00835 [Secundilactobacillus paracollinoides]ANZ63013.1 hypothetical protein AYR62_02090 [Secundilactobacillus paracollinoides]ANZ65826.1 hypothetical protein AYR63_00850 [Secundilactobacillus paracollinoides]KRL75871.1 hypothetical protein FC17_GL002362 [Secundilactobacillus paracollinoides DSM 15502 = JCM 11969]
MADKNDKITLDVKAFAEAVLGGNPKKDDEEDKVYIKRQLTLYLEAVLLAQDFNDLEETRFDVAKAEERNAILNKIIERRY